MKKFGKYLLERQLAIGGMAEIFLARQHGPAGFEKTLVLKKILPHFANDEDFITMFLDEARTSAKLNHPNLVQIYELGEIEGAYYIAMEYIRGESLNKVIRKLKKLGFHVPLHLAAKIISSVCAGLDYAHNYTSPDGEPLNLVHRDISPDNVLTSFDGAVKMIDFGIAKAKTSEHTTQAGAVKGKFSYMSPEQVTGKSLDRRSDIFSLGIVLHELTTLTKPFGEGADLMTITAIVNDPPKKASELIEGYPEGLWDVIERSLCKRREDRFESAHEMQIALERFIHSRGEFLSDRDIGSYMKKLFSDSDEDTDELREMASGIRSRVFVPPAGAAGDPDAPTMLRDQPDAYQPTEISTPAADIPVDDATQVAPAPGPTVALEQPDVAADARRQRTDIAAPAPGGSAETSGGGGALKAFIALLVVAGLGVGGYFAAQHFGKSDGKKGDSAETTSADGDDGAGATDAAAQRTTGGDDADEAPEDSGEEASDATGDKDPGDTTGAGAPDAGSTAPIEDAGAAEAPDAGAAEPADAGAVEALDSGQAASADQDAGAAPEAEDAGTAPEADDAKSPPPKEDADPAAEAPDAGAAAEQDAGPAAEPEDAGPTAEPADAGPAAEPDAGTTVEPADAGPAAEPDAGTTVEPADAGPAAEPDAGTVEAPPDAGPAVEPDAGATIQKPIEGTIVVTASSKLFVKIDGRAVGRTPLTRKYAPGKYRVQAYGDGIDKSWTITLKAGQTKRLAAKPAAKNGTISFRVPTGTIVSLDGKRLGKAPIKTQKVTIGRHRVVLINPKDASQRVTRTVRVTAGRPNVTIAF